MAPPKTDMEAGGIALQYFGKFQLLENIGSGGMAEIFLAKPLDASMSKLVAVKRIHPDYMNDPKFHEMFRQECAIVLRFRHHAIIAVHEMGTIEGQHYMSMEYFPGQTLGALMLELRQKKKTLDIDLKIHIIKNIAEALQYIHDFSDYGKPTEIIHRDISPHNILIGFDGATKLIDFGIAKVTDNDQTQSKSLKGKLPYMSPEQARSEKLTKQTDLFSLGVVFWELLVGKKLFTGSSIAELTKKVEECKVPPISIEAPDIPAEIARICTKALSKETQHRYRNATEIIADLEEFLRSKNAENRQRKLAEVVQDLFASSIEELRGKLQRYEVSKDEESEATALILSPALVPKSPPVQSSTLVRIDSIEKTKLKSKPKNLPKNPVRARPSKFPIAFTLSFTLTVLGIWHFYLSKGKNEVIQLKPLIVKSPEAERNQLLPQTPPANGLAPSVPTQTAIEKPTVPTAHQAAAPSAPSQKSLAPQPRPAPAQPTKTSLAKPSAKPIALARPKTVRRPAKKASPKPAPIAKKAPVVVKKPVLEVVPVEIDEPELREPAAVRSEP